MISNYDVRKYLEKKSTDDSYEFTVEKSKNRGGYDYDIVRKSDNKFICTLEYYADKLREAQHCDFECVWSNMIVGTVLRCKQCGCVIFTPHEEMDDYFDYKLCCPSCGNYKTDYGFWSKEEIDKDEEKQKYIKHLENCTKREIEDDDRHSRTNLMSDELYRKVIRTKKYTFEIKLKVNHWKEDKSERHLEISVFKLSPDKEYKQWNGDINIPLSVSYIKRKRALRRSTNNAT